MIGEKVINLDGFVEMLELEKHSDRMWQVLDFNTHRSLGQFSPPEYQRFLGLHRRLLMHQRRLNGAWRGWWRSTQWRLVDCSEVHVGPWGQNAKHCSKFKYQQRDEKYDWQGATVDEVFPPNYVWHVRDLKRPPMRSALKRFYGKALTLVEVCMQAGARAPEMYKPIMRLDIVVTWQWGESIGCMKWFWSSYRTMTYNTWCGLFIATKNSC